MNKLYFQTTKLNQIDAENGEILGVSVISTPIAKGHNLFVDNKSIQSFFDAVEGKQIKAFMTHESNESPSDVIGIWENFRIEEDQEFTKLLADFSALDSWKRNHPSEFDAFFELASVAPNTFGISAEFIGFGVLYDEDGEEVEWDGESEGDVFARASEVSGFSVVLEPASNPTGLFSANGKIENESEKEHEEIELEEEELIEFLDCENNELHLQIKTLEELTLLLKKERDSQQEQISDLESELESKSEESNKWKTKFNALKESGSNPIEGLHHTEETLSLSEKIQQTSSWHEKQKLFAENASELTREWNTLLGQ
jgi:hypothetical protein